MLKKLILGASLLCAAGLSHASMITYSQTVTVQRTNIVDAPVSITQFDMDNAILTSVFVQYNATYNGTAVYENTSTNSTSFATTDVDILFSLTGPLGISLDATDTYSNTVELGIYDGAIDFMGTSAFSETFSLSGANSTLFTEASDLATFVGSDVVDFSFSAIVDSLQTQTASGAKGLFSDAGALIEVTYNYVLAQSVSAPASLEVLGLTLLGLTRVKRS